MIALSVCGRHHRRNKDFYFPISVRGFQSPLPWCQYSYVMFPIQRAWYAMHPRRKSPVLCSAVLVSSAPGAAAAYLNPVICWASGLCLISPASKCSPVIGMLPCFSSDNHHGLHFSLMSVHSMDAPGLKIWRTLSPALSQHFSPGP